MRRMIADGYQDAETLRHRIEAAQAWIARPELLSADPQAEYAALIEIDEMAEYQDLGGEA